MMRHLSAVCPLSVVTVRSHFQSLSNASGGLTVLQGCGWKVSQLVQQQRAYTSKNIISTQKSTISTATKSTSKWTDEEIAKLQRLAEKGQEHVWNPVTQVWVKPWMDWTEVGKELGRMPDECKRKWRQVEYRGKGPITPEEDALILQRVEEWSDQELGQGLWTSLAKELERNSHTIRARWIGLQSGVSLSTQWTKDKDAALQAVVEELRPNGDTSTRIKWSAVAERLTSRGWPVESIQCKDRYNSCLKLKLKGLRTEVEWTPELMTSMRMLREHGLKWAEIGRKLSILPGACQTKWRGEQNKRLKQGLFTAEEDALIRQRVKEWGDPKEKKGLWVKLEREMGRPSLRVSQRWFKTLFTRKE